MDKLHKILVPIDGSKKSFEALDRALTLAGFTHGEVTCLNVIPHVIKEGGPRTKAIDEQLISDSDVLLKKAMKHAGNKNVQFKTKVIRGSPSHEIIKLSQSGKLVGVDVLVGVEVLVGVNVGVGVGVSGSQRQIIHRGAA